MIYDSGIIEIYSLPDTGNGNLPGTTGVLKGKAYFGYKTVGYHRYFTAKANHDRVDNIVECWAIPGVDTTNYAMIGTTRYNIIQVQYDTENGLPIMSISLERQNDEQN